MAPHWSCYHLKWVRGDNTSQDSRFHAEILIGNLHTDTAADARPFSAGPTQLCTAGALFSGDATLYQYSQVVLYLFILGRRCLSLSAFKMIAASQRQRADYVTSHPISANVSSPVSKLAHFHCPFLTVRLFISSLHVFYHIYLANFRFLSSPLFISNARWKSPLSTDLLSSVPFVTNVWLLTFREPLSSAQIPEP
jgi:hypothetical protein